MLPPTVSAVVLLPPAVAMLLLYIPAMKLPDVQSSEWKWSVGGAGERGGGPNPGRLITESSGYWRGTFMLMYFFCFADRAALIFPPSTMKLPIFSDTFSSSKAKKPLGFSSKLVRMKRNKYYFAFSLVHGMMLESVSFLPKCVNYDSLLCLIVFTTRGKYFFHGNPNKTDD